MKRLPKTIGVVIMLALFALLYYYFVQKQCTPLPAEFFIESPPIEERPDKDMRGNFYKIWQNIDGVWNSCGTRFEKAWHF